MACHSTVNTPIFDNDGTLMESMYYWRLAGIEYMIAHRLPIPGEMTLREMFSHSSRAFSEDIARYEPGASFESVVAGDGGNAWAATIATMWWKNRAWAISSPLCARGGARLCVATAAPRALCSVALERLGLRPHFEFVTDSYEVGLGKSDPAYFPAVARRLGCALEECWVFEDALHAMESAKAAGMRVCAIADYTNEPQREAIFSRRRRLHKRLPPPAAHAAPRGRAFGKMTATRQHMPWFVRIINTFVRDTRILSHVFPKNACFVRGLPV